MFLLAPLAFPPAQIAGFIFLPESLALLPAQILLPLSVAEFQAS
jgi:hypothetical protein